MRKFSAFERHFAHLLLNVGAIQTKAASPDGKGFRLALHEHDPSAPLSPIYVNLRKLRSHPRAMRYAIRIFLKLLRLCKPFDAIADVPTAGTPFASILAYRLYTPMVTPRPPKTHGSVGDCDGDIRPGQRVVLIDDVITTGGSKLAPIDTLTRYGALVAAIVVLVDREQGDRMALVRYGIPLRAAFTLRELLDIYVADGALSGDEQREILAYGDRSR